MADEQRTPGVTPGVFIPAAHGMSREETENVIADMATMEPATALSLAITLNSGSVALLAGIAERLENRRKEIDDILSIIKSQREVIHKLERAARRLLAEETKDAG